MKACFADNVEIPIECSHDLGEPCNCLIANSGVARDACRYWRPDMAVALCRSILGDSWQLVKHEIICCRCGLRQGGTATGREVVF